MMSRRRNVTFEVVVEQGGKPNIDGVFPDEAAARERAAYLLRLAKFPVVRILKVNQAGKEEVVFQKSTSGGGKPTTISSIDESDAGPASLCTDALQLFSYESRMLLLRLLRGYWDDQAVIPAEQLHRYYPLRYFEREALLFNPAISRLATLQAPLLGIKPFERHDQLSRLFAALKDLAQASDTLAPFDAALARNGVGGLLAAAAERPPEERDRLVTHAFGAVLEPCRDWPGKVKALLRFHREDEEEANRRVLDQMLAETVDGREPVRALIGYAPDLGAALQSLVAAVHGVLDDRLPFTDELLALSNALGGGGFDETRTALLRRIQGGLAGLTPLTRTGDSAEGKAFGLIVEGLTNFDGFLGGAGMAEALTRRAKTVWSAGGQDAPFDTAVQRLATRLPAPAQRIGYLLDLATSPFGRNKLSLLIRQVAAEFESITSARELAAPGVRTEDVRNGLGRRLRAAGIPRALAEGLIARIAAIPDGERSLGIPLLAAPDAGAVTRATEETVLIDAPRAAADRLVLFWRGRTQAIPEDGTQLVIGRSSQCQFVLDIASASRRHAAVSRQDGLFVVEDLSRNGTSIAVPGVVEPRRLTPGEPLPLPPRGEIVIGSAELGEEPARIAWEIVRR
ncbi:FHA domain-containing protein [Azospirillum isscasi]|uniref:FHA domain-containing protein n=1 Tax=Azospirillum isscasi TaxID=3053926 RepID=A0ABU0WQW6_9PROT|nr:FHA domain-containing protein [Azospirillum isscasi]MDQ2106640.1 FHA domain-containing protein [Azospirillum isscasi]